MKIFTKSIITFDKNLKIYLIISSLMYINVIAIHKTNMSLIDELAKPTSESFKKCDYEVMASQWSCFQDASKKWQVNLETLLQDPPKNKKYCCAFHNACNCMKTFTKLNDFCKYNEEYKTYFNTIVDLYAKDEKCLSENVAPDSFACSAATNLLVNYKINYIFYFIISFLLIINSFHSNFM
jgi:hypothetical protein